MSTSPGTTCSPETSIVFDAAAELICGATAAILPAAIATSRVALMLLRESMRCPPRRSNSYFGVWAWPARPRRSSSGTTSRVCIEISSTSRTPWPSALLGQLRYPITRLPDNPITRFSSCLRVFVVAFSREVVRDRGAIRLRNPPAGTHHVVDIDRVVDVEGRIGIEQQEIRHLPGPNRPVLGIL